MFLLALQLLYNVILLWHELTLVKLPDKVPQQTHDGNEQGREPKEGRSKEGTTHAEEIREAGRTAE